MHTETNVQIPHQQPDQSEEDTYNDTTIGNDETIEGGLDFFPSQPSPTDVGGQVESSKARTARQLGQ